MPRSRCIPSVHSFTSSSSSARSTFRRRSSGFIPSSRPSLPSKDDQDASPSDPISQPKITSQTIKDEQPDVFMSICTSQERVGCAAYEVENGRLSLLEDCPIRTGDYATMPRLLDNQEEKTSQSNDGDEEQDTGHSSSLICSIIQRFKPNLVLISKSCPTAVIEAIKTELFKLHSVLQIRPAKEFNKEQGIAQLLDFRARISSARRGHRVAATKFYSSPQLALDNLPLSVSATHALLSHLQRSAVFQQQQDGNESHSTLSVTSIELISLSDTMLITADTLKALCIFDEEEHAVVHSQRGKEGLSLFGLLNCVQTPTSRALLRRWLLFPSRCLATLEARFDAVELFVRDARMCESLRREIKGVKNFERLAARLVDGNADLSTWRGTSEFVSRCLLILHHCASIDEAGQEVEIIHTITSTFNKDLLQSIRRSIEDVIDWDESRLSQRICVKGGIDVQMDEWRQIYTNLPSILNTIVSKITEEIGHSLDPAYHLFIEYFPQVGYLQALCRKDGSMTNEGSIRVGEAMGWEYQYSSEIKAYFKTDETKELDSQLGDLYSFISGREIEIIQDLIDTVAQHLNWLISCSEVIAELDCLLSFAFVAGRNGYIRPILTDQPILDIHEGRHPLQELIVETFVPNSTAVEGGRGVGVEEDDERFNSITIITGANACGKSIYLKQSALIVYMAQVGSFVPAKSARIGVVDKIFTRMQATESSSKMQSSFLLDILQVSQALHSSTRQSLILLDEMGKGTSSTDGAALFAATIKHLLGRGHQCPRTLAATHFHEVFHDDYLSDSLPFTPAHMQVMLGRDSTKIDEEITFLYKLRYGLQLTSHATQCELLCGIPESIVERAAYIAQLSRDHNLSELQLRIQDAFQGEETMQDDITTEDLHRMEGIARAFVQWDLRTDEVNAAREGNLPTLDPLRKLNSILGGRLDQSEAC